MHPSPLRLLGLQRPTTNVRRAIDHARRYERPDAPSFGADAQPTATSDDGSRTLRTREHGHRSLPLPPLMDPIAIKAQTKHWHPKSREPLDEKDMTPLQKAVAANPYAFALTTPVRRCALSKVVLPSDFLVGFKTGNPMTKKDNEAGIVDKRHALVPALGFKTMATKAYAFCSAESMDQLVGKQGRWRSLVTDVFKRRHAQREGKNADNVKVAKEWKLRYGDDTPRFVHRQLVNNALHNLKKSFTDSTWGPLLVPYSENVEPQTVSCIVHIAEGTDHERPQPILGVENFYLADYLLEVHSERVKAFFGREPSTFALLKHWSSSFSHRSLLRLRIYTGR